MSDVLYVQIEDHYRRILMIIIFSCISDLNIVRVIMATLMPMEAPKAGFNFENCKRNAFLSQVTSQVLIKLDLVIFTLRC